MIVREVVGVRAPLAVLRRLVLDRAQRERFLPEGWRVYRQLSERTDVVGASMELVTNVGGGPSQVVTLLEFGDDHVVEGPPTADNFISTWTFREYDDGTLVMLETEFSHGGGWLDFPLLGEWFVARRLRKAHQEMLLRLAAVAEEVPGP